MNVWTLPLISGCVGDTFFYSGFDQDCPLYVELWGNECCSSLPDSLGVGAHLWVFVLSLT
jgi:hypothetical protein